MAMIEKEAKEQSSEIPEQDQLTAIEERESSQALMKSVKNNIKNREWEANLMVLNSKRKQVYSDNSAEDEELYQLCLSMLDEEKIPVKIAKKIETGRGECLVQIFEMEAINKVRAKY